MTANGERAVTTRGVRPISSDNIARIYKGAVVTHLDVRPDLYARKAANDAAYAEAERRAENTRRTKARYERIRRAERTAAWWRRQSAPIGVALYVLAVVIVCFFLFQMGRGAF